MSESNIIHKKITVTGLVQGVGFRYACIENANSIGIKGFVKNVSDGSVYIEAEGSEKQLIQFIDWCSLGPRYGRIEEVKVKNDEIKGFKQFVVMH